MQGVRCVSSFVQIPLISTDPVSIASRCGQNSCQWQAETRYPKPQDWVFPSFKLRGRKPRTGSIMAQDYLRPAAVKAGILTEGDRRRFGFHNLRHSLASYLIKQTKTDIKTILRYAAAR
jgi:integrase